MCTSLYEQHVNFLVTYNIVITQTVTDEEMVCDILFYYFFFSKNALDLHSESNKKISLYIVEMLGEFPTNANRE